MVEAARLKRVGTVLSANPQFLPQGVVHNTAAAFSGAAGEESAG